MDFENPARNLIEKVDPELNRYLGKDKEMNLENLFSIYQVSKEAKKTINEYVNEVNDAYRGKIEEIRRDTDKRKDIRKAGFYVSVMVAGTIGGLAGLLINENNNHWNYAVSAGFIGAVIEGVVPIYSKLIYALWVNKEMKEPRRFRNKKREETISRLESML